MSGGGVGGEICPFLVIEGRVAHDERAVDAVRGRLEAIATIRGHLVEELAEHTYAYVIREGLLRPSEHAQNSPLWQKQTLVKCY